MVSMDKKDTHALRGPDLKLYVRDVRDKQRKKRPITVRSWSTIKDVKDQIQQILHVPPSAQRLYFGPLMTSGGELPNHRTLHDAGIYRSGETLLLDIKSSALVGSPLYSSIYSLRSSCNDVCISSSMMDSTPKDLKALVQEARRGFALGLKPDFVLEGSGGSYFLHDARKNKIAIFKPADEEPYAENNPRGYLRQPGQQMSLRAGVVPGEACIREVAAYLLDHDGMCGVPMTTLAEARHPAFNTNGARLKVAEGGASIGSHSISINSPVQSQTMKKAGSFQEFMNCECTMDDISPSKISANEIHKIAILDIRLMNADRNSANLLVRRKADKSYQLVPIDHGYCLRSVADVSWMDWCWLDWPQLKKPLSDKMNKYVLGLDIEEDARMLSERLNICQEAIDYFRASSSLLKEGVKAGLTLYDIAILCCRNDNLAVIPSMLEKLVDMASELATSAVENERWHHTAASRALAEQLSPAKKHRGTVMFRLSSSGSRMSKSASSAEFRTLRRDLTERERTLEQALSAHDQPPAVVQSSASSDSGSEAGEAEKDDCDCEEWAASIIMDVSVDQGIPRNRGVRSSSINSDDASSDSGLSSSPKGFWHIRPGTLQFQVADDDSVKWSQQGSPRTSVVAKSEYLETMPPVSLDDSQEFKSPTVTFATLISAPGPYLRPHTVNVPQFNGNFLDDEFLMLQRTESGMSRSKSYSALSAAAYAGKLSAHSAPRRPQHLAENYEVYRKYFHNFIDLVIVRETAAAKRKSKYGCIDVGP